MNQFPKYCTVRQSIQETDNFPELTIYRDLMSARSLSPEYFKDQARKAEVKSTTSPIHKYSTSPMIHLITVPTPVSPNPIVFPF